MAGLLVQALGATLADLVAGLPLVVSIVLIVGLIWAEARDARRDEEVEVEVERADAWASLPPKWSPPCAESDLESEGERAA